MNKLELVKTVAKNKAIEEKKVCIIIDEVLKVISDELIKGNNVKLPSVGTIASVVQAEKRYWNPATKSHGLIGKRKSIKMIPSQKLKDLMNK